MSKEIINRLKALEAQQPVHIVVLAEDASGNRFECTVTEYLEHDAPVEKTYPNGQKYTGREWDFIKVVSGTNLDEIYQIIDSIDSAF